MPGATVWTSDIWTSGAVLRGGGGLMPAVGGVAAGAGEQGCLRLSCPLDSCVWRGMLSFQKACQTGNPP